eukprot:3133192-Rhodomonas_salina.2
MSVCAVWYCHSLGCYALPGTYKACAATTRDRRTLPAYGLATRCAVATHAIGLGACYAVRGSDVAYGTGAHCLQRVCGGPVRTVG